MRLFANEFLKIRRSKSVKILFGVFLAFIILSAYAGNYTGSAKMRSGFAGPFLWTGIMGATGLHGIPHRGVRFRSGGDTPFRVSAQGSGLYRRRSGGPAVLRFHVHLLCLSLPESLRHLCGFCPGHSPGDLRQRQAHQGGCHKRQWNQRPFHHHFPFVAAFRLGHDTHAGVCPSDPPLHRPHGHFAVGKLFFIHEKERVGANEKHIRRGTL